MQPNLPQFPQQAPLAPNPYAQLNQPLPPKPKPHAPWLLIALIGTILVVLLMTALFIWAMMGRQDYKANSDQKVAKAVEVAKQQEAVAKDKEFLEKEKYPLKTYQGPANYGSIAITYPKSWSAFVTESTSGSTLIDGYFHPNFVPGLQSGTAFALRVQVVSRAYAEELKQFDGMVKVGKVRVTPYSPPKMPNITGSKVEGEINKGQKDTMILFPLRDKTIKVSTESEQFVNDLNNNILANLSFVP